MVFTSWILNWSGVTTNIKDVAGKVTIEKIKVMGILDIFYAILSSFGERASLILFILIIGSYINIMFKSKSLEAKLGRLVKRSKEREILLIPALMILFSLGGTTFGMAEETISFYLFLIHVFIAAGFDALTAINEAVGSDVLTTTTGIAFRVIGFILLVSISITFVMLYARKVKINASYSTIYSIKILEWHLNFNLLLILHQKEKHHLLFFIYHLLF